MPCDPTSGALGLRVLVVEDELVIALAIEQILEDLGCVVVGPAPSVVRALALMAGEEIDFAILDVNLGRTRSTPVAEELHARGVPFAVATGYDRAQLPEAVFDGVPHLGKPLSERCLAATLETLRDGRT